MSDRKLHRGGSTRKPVQAVLKGIGRIAILTLVMLSAEAASAGTAAPDRQFSLDQRFGSIGSSVRHLGLFSSQGEFRKFEAHLVLNGSHPEHTKISVAVEAGSVDMSWGEGADMLRSPDFFDVQRYPEVRFRSTSVQPVSPGHFMIGGLVRIRGVTRALTLDAVLTKRDVDARTKAEVADFIIRGSLSRSAFGMTADEVFISDKVNIVIKARLELPRGAEAG